MERNLYDAAIQGDTAILSQLLQRNPYLIDTTYLHCEDKNVLHISAMLGHKEFMQAILNDSSSSYDMCLARDREGRNPLHLAAIHGKLNILSLIEFDDRLMLAAREKVDRGGTILHLCVKHNQLDALELLLKISSFADRDFLRSINEGGMSILHLAFQFYQNERRREIIIYLIQNRKNMINQKDANGWTALDHFEKKSRIESRKSSLQPNEQTIHRSLLKAHAETGLPNFLSDENINKNYDAMMVVATLIGSMAFQAMISPPGGVWQDDNPNDPTNPHRVGQSVMAQTHPSLYKQFIRSNAVAFVLSLTTILMLWRPYYRRRAIYSTFRGKLVLFLLSMAMLVSVTAISVAYATSLVTVAPESVRGLRSAPGEIAVVVIMVWSFPLISFICELIGDFKVGRPSCT